MSYLFKVVDKETDLVVFVHGVRDDKTGFPHFLIYEDNQWKYKSAKHFIPFWERRYEEDFI